MTSIREAIKRMLAPVEPLPAGIYHYIAPPEDPRNYRFHLRLEKDGSGLLIVNAATVLHLNRTAAEFAYHLVIQTPPDQMARQISRRYKINPETARQEFQDFVDRIETLATTPDLDPETYLDFDRARPFTEISAPYRIDCALTYRLTQTDQPEAAPVERVDRELSTQEWQTILDKAWKAGIPQVVFTGGEPTLRDDLAELAAYAETKGMVSGLLTDGVRLRDQAYRAKLLGTGLDHVTIILDDADQNAWESLEALLAVDIYVAVHLTLTPENKATLMQKIDRMQAMGVKAFSLSATDPALEDALQDVRNQAAEAGISLVWNLPVPYSHLHPVALETTQEETPQGAGRAWIYVEPDGDVLPTQGRNQVLGNLLHDPWDTIWEASLAALHA